MRASPASADQLVLSFLALPSSQAACAFVAGLMPVQWEELIAAVQRHQLAPLLYNRLTTSRLTARLPAAARDRLHSHYLSAVALSLRRERELRTVLSALGAAGIRPVVFKGAVLAHTLYPDPACRPMGDIDLWVQAGEMAPAQAALAAIGYRQQTKAARPLALQQHQDGEVQMVGTHHGQGLVELHWGVFAGQVVGRTTSIDRHALRERCVPLDLMSCPVWTMAPEDTLIQLAVHICINHQMTTNVLRSLMDVALCAQQPLDWPTVVVRAEAWRVKTVVGHVLARIQPWLTSPAVQEAAAALAPAAWRRRLLDWLAPPPGLQERPALAHSRLRLLFLLGSVDGPQRAALLVGRALWPEQEWLEARYGQAGLRTRIGHLLTTGAGKI